MRLTQALHMAARQTPDPPAAVFTGRTRTWRECRDRVARSAAALRSNGAGPGDRVPIEPPHLRHVCAGETSSKGPPPCSAATS
ncbi:AMP-binding protein [Actinoplanes sp. NPDC051851]|uniref:AMP-binding protein n=1 Tax=Actinoplanes sp. NPDC051851 TaxID=3154753 RepID=UPI003430D71D